MALAYPIKSEYNYLQYSEYNSAAWVFVNQSIGPWQYALTRVDWLKLSKRSRLYPLLNKVYPSIGAFMDAWTSQGGMSDFNAANGMKYSGSLWVLDSDGYPAMYMPGAASGIDQPFDFYYVVLLGVAHSTSA